MDHSIVDCKVGFQLLSVCYVPGTSKISHMEVKMELEGKHFPEAHSADLLDQILGNISNDKFFF